MTELKSYEKALEFFTRAAKGSQPGEVILFHNQRHNVAKLMMESADVCGKKLIDKDLSTLENNELRCMKMDENIPCWVKPVFAKKSPGFIVYLRDYHLASEKIQDEVLNILATREIQGKKFPPNVLLVLGVRKEDDVAEAITKTHVVTFYK
ncbi:MAG: hypothetical protein LLG37_08895 [Spirochaetia bacterium]|nr:hypothetical protein [Spirochaetia bacterium]